MARRFTAAKALGEIARNEPELIKQRWECLMIIKKPGIPNYRDARHILT